MLVRELGMTATAVAKILHTGQPVVSMAIARGEVLMRERNLTVRDVVGEGKERGEEHDENQRI
jgi:predicted transcriptional regulator